MIYKLILKLIPPLIYSVIFLAIFYWQFIYIYGSIIQNFEKSKLSILYVYIFIYTYGILILSVTVINLIYKYLIKNRIFPLIVLISIIIFYTLSFKDIYHIIEFFLKSPLYSSSRFLTIFFIVLSFGYTFYTLFLALFGKVLNTLEIFSITTIGIIYSIYVIYKI